jgi:hypothetical protein
MGAEVCVDPSRTREGEILAAPAGDGASAEPEPAEAVTA